MRLIHLAIGLIIAVVTLMWVSVQIYRYPSLDQIPVRDNDVTTAQTVMWVHAWQSEGVFNLWFSTPKSPLSFEDPTLDSRELYQSWPPGAFIPIYLLSEALGEEVSVPLINWYNTVTHGFIALAVAFIGFSLARLNKINLIASTLIAIAAAPPILFPRGLVYFFSQIYCVTTSILLFVAIFIMLDALSYVTASRHNRRVLFVLQLLIIYFAFFVDWLSYTLFASWLLVRFIGGRFGLIEPWSRRQIAGLLMLPVTAFAIYMFWRIFSPGSIAQRDGPLASLYELGWKIAFRMNLLETNHIANFSEIFANMHSYYYSPHMMPLTAIATGVSVVLLGVAFLVTPRDGQRNAIFAVAALLFLVTVPFYVHMLVLYQHTAIHRWAIAKAMFAYSLVPFAILPISVVITVRQLAGKFASLGSSRIFQAGASVAAVLMGATALYSAELSANTFERPYLMGGIGRERYQTFLEINRNAGFREIFFTPDPTLDASSKMSAALGIANKRVYQARNFGDIYKQTLRLCGDFNAVLVVRKGDELPKEFALRAPSQVVETDHLRLFRYIAYPGRALGCP
jgi:hypothetical protein